METKLKNKWYLAARDKGEKDGRDGRSVNFASSSSGNGTGEKGRQQIGPGRRGVRKANIVSEPDGQLLSESCKIKFSNNNSGITKRADM